MTVGTPETSRTIALAIVRSARSELLALMRRKQTVKAKSTHWVSGKTHETVVWRVPWRAVILGVEVRLSKVGVRRRIIGSLHQSW